MCEYVYTHTINCAWYSTEIHSNQTLSKKVAGRRWQDDSVPVSTYSIVSVTNPTHIYVCNMHHTAIFEKCFQVNGLSVVYSPYYIVHVMR